MYQTNYIETGKKLIQDIERDAGSRESAWKFVSREWLPELRSKPIEAGWSAADVTYGLAAVMARVNRLLGAQSLNRDPYLQNRRSEIRNRLGRNFFLFMEEGVLDVLLIKDFQENKGKKARIYLERQWLEDFKQKLFAGNALMAPTLQENFQLCLDGLQYRLSQNLINLQEYALADYLFDECLIVLIENGSDSTKRVLHYIQTHWYHYLTSMIADPQLARATFNEVMTGFWKRIDHPQKAGRLYLENRLKTYLYRSMCNAYPRQKEVLKVGGDPHLPGEFDLIDLLNALELEKYPDGLPPDKEKKVPKDRWATLNLSYAERQAAIAHLTPTCKKLFELDADGLRDVVIAGILGYSSEGNVKNQRWKCNAKIEKFIQKLRKTRP